MGKFLTILFISIGLLASISGCDTDGCLENQSSIPLAGFYSASSKTNISLDSLEIGGIGAPNDSLIVSSGTNVSQAYLPFRSSESATAFYLHYEYKTLNNTALNDTLWFEYTSNPYFVSEECGAMYQYDITSVKYTTHLIDSIAITDSTITNLDIERIRIYFRTIEIEE